MKPTSTLNDPAKAAPPAASQKKHLIMLFLPVLVAVLLLLTPVPAGLEPYAWHFFAIFVGVIVGLIFEPLPGAVIGLTGVVVIALFSQWLLFSPEEIANPKFKMLIAFTGPGTTNLIFALGVASVPRFTRVVRAQTFLVMSSGYVEQARTLGLKRHVLVWRHVLPHAIAHVPALATLGLCTAIIGTAGLSFLGMGPQPPTAEWGLMLAEGRNYLRNAWWIGVWPGVAITLTVISVNTLGRYWQATFEGKRP